MKKNKLQKNQNGITIVGLVITIIVLLILAAITINLTIGENGIITKAQQVGQVQKVAEIKEQIEMAILDVQAEAYQTQKLCTLESLKDGLPTRLLGITVDDDTNGLTGICSSYVYTIDENFQVKIGEIIKNSPLPNVIAIQK